MDKYFLKKWAMAIVVKVLNSKEEVPKGYFGYFLRWFPGSGWKYYQNIVLTKNFDINIVSVSNSALDTCTINYQLPNGEIRVNS